LDVNAVYLLFGAGALYSLKSWLSVLSKWLRGQFLISMEIRGVTRAYHYVLRWMQACIDVEKRNQLDVSVFYCDGTPMVTLSLGTGLHRVKYKDCTLWVERRRGDAKETDNREFASETITIFTLPWNRKVLLNILSEAEYHYLNADAGKTVIYVSGQFGTEWKRAAVKPIRPLESVILRAGVLDSLVSDLREFIGSERRYVSRGIPWQRGYLFEGPPGTGKSSLAMALAGTVGRNLAIVTLADKQMSDARLYELLAQLPANAIVLLEDLDTILDGRSVKGNGDLTFTGLLNAIDGAAASHGRILITTTNLLGSLDAAVIRPGRIDRIEHIGLATAAQAAAYYARFMGVPEHCEAATLFGLQNEGEPMAAIQAVLMSSESGSLREESMSLAAD
jgi:chaperone BCS1